MPILRLLRTAAFDPEATETLSSAFDTAWNVLRGSGSTLVANNKAVMTRELLAKQIIALGRTGERNQERLVKDALAHVASCETISRGVGRLRAKRNGRGSQIKSDKVQQGRGVEMSKERASDLARQCTELIRKGNDFRTVWSTLLKRHILVEGIHGKNWNAIGVF